MNRRNFIQTLLGVSALASLPVLAWTENREIERYNHFCGIGRYSERGLQIPMWDMYPDNETFNKMYKKKVSKD